MKEFKIGHRIIGQEHPCYIIAEIGLNHNGKEGLAIKMVEEAAKAGADAVKLSRLDAHFLLAKTKDYETNHSEAISGEKDYSQKLELTYETIDKVAQLCKKLDIAFLSTPSDNEDVNFLMKIGIPAIKIASGDLTNDPLLRCAAIQKIPIILSTGMSSLDEVRQAVSILLESGCPDLTLLHCVSEYPAKLEELNLRVINTLVKEFDIPIGFSDHTVGIEAAPIAVAAGANIIEKHFTLNKELPGLDHRFSVDPYELSKMIKEIRNVEIMMGMEKKNPTPTELEFRKFGRRSIVTKCVIEAETVITEEMLTMKRPGTGISPRDLYKVLGKKARVRLNQDEIITWDKIH